MKLFSLNKLQKTQTQKSYQRSLNRLVMFITVFLVLNYRYWTGKQQYPLLCNLLLISCPKWPVKGFANQGYENVVSAFKENFILGQEIGASFTAYVGDTRVVELYGGYHDRFYQRPYDDTTLQLVFSSSKVVEGIVIQYLVEQGLLNYSDKIAKHWPEFAQGNKQDVTVACLLGHRAGVTYLDKAPSLQDIADLDRMAVLLAGQRHNFNGTQMQGYHAITRGWYLNELVRRVAGKSMGQLIRQELMPRLNVEFYLGIPHNLEYRISPLSGVPILRSLAKFLTPPKYRKEPLPQALGQLLSDWNSVGAKALFSQPRQIMPWPHSHNRKQIWRAEGPSYAGITNSVSLATFAALMANDGTFKNQKLLSPDVVEAGHVPLPWMKDHVVSRNVTFSQGGWGIDMTFPGSDVKWTGWGGVGGSMVFWNREKRLAFSYVMNSLSHSGIGDERSFRLIREFITAFERTRS
ncbi:beta-lactamase/transpeptidase-like protein, partial [Gorgonomyces haynaldii]